MYIVTAKEMYDIDRYTMQEIGIEGKLLMENAGREVCKRLETILEENKLITILVGAGNNGGDGFVIARTLLNQMHSVHVIQVVPDGKITGDVLYHKNLYLNCGGSVNYVEQAQDADELIKHADFIIDAMVGIGVKGVLKEPVSTIVTMVNEGPAYVISVDIPSGLPADEGESNFKSVQADYTIVIAAPKISAFLQHTAPYYGKWEVVSIGLPLPVFQQYADRHVITAEQFKKTMPKRNKYSHKGSHGNGLIVGGSPEMPGSLIMSVKAALKAGAGLITAGTYRKVISAVASQCIEATYLSIPETNAFSGNDHPIPTENYDAIALGMGMGRHDETRALVSDIMRQANCPLVIDADGLYHLKNELTILQARTGAPTIITPHPGEMAMLLNISVEALLEAPFQHALAFAETHQVYVILKGTYTIITAPDGKQAVSTAGNPGLAKGGSGDVLTGIVLAMVMQDPSVFQALCNACFIHGTSADLLVEESHSYHDVMASDVIEGISKVYRTFS